MFITRFIIHGSHYYSLIAHARQENPALKNFFNSFELKPFVYGAIKARKDTMLFYTVKSPVFPHQKKERLSFANSPNYMNDGDDDSNDNDVLEKGIYRNALIADDSTGQKIYVSFYKPGRYRFDKDTSRLKQKDFKSYFGGDSTWMVKNLRKQNLPGNVKTWEYELGKKTSSRQFHKKDFYKDGIMFSVSTETDSLTKPDEFEQTFFETFTPFDTLHSLNPFIKKSKYFFDDFFNPDSIAHKRAVDNIGDMVFEKNDFPSIKKAIASFSWSQKKYLETKKAFIAKLKDIDAKEASDYLKATYYAAGDTIELQYTALEILLQQQTAYAMNLFRDIITLEPPVLQAQNKSWTNFLPRNSFNYARHFRYSNGEFFDDLYDSLKLTRTVLPGLLPLINIDDYKWPVMRLLARMVDSGLVSTKDYDTYFPKLLLEARLALKKQIIAEKKKAIKKAEDSKGSKSPKNYSLYDDDGEIRDFGNDDLSVYATLLLPYHKSNPQVDELFDQLLRSSDVKLKYNTMFLLLRNGRKIPDSLPAFFAAMNDYRYDLYNDLQELGKPELFPKRYNNHLDLAYSKLFNLKAYDKPDSLIYLDTLSADFKGNHGLIYFFKYKQKKDDDGWKLAVAGLVPRDSTSFEFQDDQFNDNEYLQIDDFSGTDFTQLTETRLKDDELLSDQLQSLLKKLFNSTRKSAKEFYDNTESNEARVAAPRRY